MSAFMGPMALVLLIAGAVILVLGIRGWRHANTKWQAARAQFGDDVEEPHERTRGAAVIIAGAYLLALGVAAACGSAAAFGFTLAIPLGAAMAAAGVGFLTAPIRYREPIQAEFVKSTSEVTARETKDRRLVFRYITDETQFEEESQDTARQAWIDEKLVSGNEYRIWVNPKHPERFKYHRFEQIAPAVVAIFVGIAFVVAPFYWFL